LSTILTIPSAVVPDIREGLFCLIGRAAQGLEEHRQSLEEALDRYLPLLAYQQTEADLDDERRVGEGKSPIKAQITERMSALRALATLIAEQRAP
jgi:hypothetical protein